MKSENQETAGTSTGNEGSRHASVGMEDIVRAHHVLREVIVRTPLQRMLCCRPNITVTSI